jgi:hypothetical protein
MSLINDALKQARQAPPRNPPNSMPPLQPAAHNEGSPMAVWVVPAVIILLVFAAIFFIGWGVARRTVTDSYVSTPIDPETTQRVETASTPVVEPVAPPPVVLPDLPRLQGIFYSPTTPSAILDGKNVHPGDQFKQFKVKEISKYTVTLIDADKKEYKVGMGN